MFTKIIKEIIIQPNIKFYKIINCLVIYIEIEYTSANIT